MTSVKCFLEPDKIINSANGKVDKILTSRIKTINIHTLETLYSPDPRRESSSIIALILRLGRETLLSRTEQYDST